MDSVFLIDDDEVPTHAEKHAHCTTWLIRTTHFAQHEEKNLNGHEHCPWRWEKDTGVADCFRPTARSTPKIV